MGSCTPVEVKMVHWGCGRPMLVKPMASGNVWTVSQVRINNRKIKSYIYYYTSTWILPPRWCSCTWQTGDSQLRSPDGDNSSKLWNILLLRLSTLYIHADLYYLSEISSYQVLSFSSYFLFIQQCSIAFDRKDDLPMLWLLYFCYLAGK